MKRWIAGPIAVVLAALGGGAVPAAVADEVSTAQDVSFTDPSHDTLGGASCPGDIQSYGASYTEPTLALWFTTRCGASPGSWPVFSEMTWAIDLGGYPEPEFLVRYRAPSGSPSVIVQRVRDGAIVCSGVQSWNGSTLHTATVPESCISRASAFRFQATFAWGDDTIDLAPNAGYTGWIFHTYRNIPAGDGAGVASAVPGQLDVFVRGQDDRLYVQHFNGSWGGYAGLGGVLTSAPAAASRGAGLLDVFVRGQDNALYTRHFDGSTWGDWVGLGGILSTAPAVVSRSPGSLDLVVTGVDRALWTRHFDGTAWTDWTSIGGIATTAPALASADPATLALFVRGQDDALWTRRLDGASWTDWSSLGGVLTSAPAATSRAPGTYDVFVRGLDNGLWQRRFDGSSWFGWLFRAGTLASPPAATALADGSLHVFVRGENARLYWDRTYPDGQLWFGWLDLDGVIK